MTAQRQNPAPLNTFYALYFMTIGITLPFLPPYLKSLSLTATQVGLLMSIGPALAMVCPPLWGQWVDRSGRPGLVLLTLCCGGAAGLTALLFADGFTSALIGMVVMTTFTSAVTAVADTLALNQVQQSGGSYAQIRSFGSMGFVVSTLVFGLAVTRIDRAIVTVPLALMLLTAMWVGVTLRSRRSLETTGPRASLTEAFNLLSDRRVSWLLLATALHWIASAPYHAALGIHFSAMKFAPLVISLSSFVAVASEVIVMATSPRWFGRFSPRVLLLAAFGVSVIRWFAMSMTDSALVLCLLASLHGLSFGAFYIAAVNTMTELAPGSLRATGQSLFSAITFGLGGLIGNSATGAIYDAFGGHTLFAIAGVFELLPLVVIFFWRGITPGPTPALSSVER